MNTRTIPPTGDAIRHKCGYIIPTQHEKNEWSRMATAAYARGINRVGHRYSAAAALPHAGMLEIERFDMLQQGYRAWLVFNDFAPAQALCGF